MIRRVFSSRLVLAALAMPAVTAAVVVETAGCQQTATAVPVRSLERSGRVSFVCLGPPTTDSADRPELPLEACSNANYTDINSYPFADPDAGADAGANADNPGQPHLYALVTQTTRGEVAVIDTSSLLRQVLDQNPIEPGANLLPIGAQPTSIVSTPGSVATFVAVAEIGRAGIFVLPSSRIRPAAAGAPYTGGAGGSISTGGAGGATFDPGVPQLTTWPACGLPAAPGEMILINDPRDADLERRSCDGDYESVDPAELLSSVEQRGRQKLVVVIPDPGPDANGDPQPGGIVVIDAQTLLDRPSGSFDACPIERWLPLQADIKGFSGTAPPPPAGNACANPKLPGPALKPPYTSRPGGITYANNTLYVSDLAAPVIHVIDMPSPCEPVERAPLLPFSAENPKRVVTTSRVSVAPAPTPDLKQYLFATDIEDGSLMMFDVGPSSSSRLPVTRSHPEYNPFQPRDRVRYNAPASDVLVVQYDVPAVDPATGLTVAGVRCDPDPALLQCVPGFSTCDIATSYRTSEDFSTGAGPAKLRGTFALAALTSGKLAVIDIDDLDAKCRGPWTPSLGAGCAADGDPTVLLKSTNELSCNIVEPGTPRSVYFQLNNDNTGTHAPGINAFPLLHDINGSLLDFSATDTRMVPPIGAANTGLYVSGAVEALDGTHHELSMNLEDPRAQIYDQDWTVTFEGTLPAFGGLLSDLRVPLVKSPAPKDPVGLYDENARFCDNGVQSEAAAKELYGAKLPQSTDREWARLADYAQIFSELPDELDPYWAKLSTQFKEQAQNPNQVQCVANLVEDNVVVGQRAMTHADCFAEFGALDAPKTGRDLRIVEAYQDRILLERRPEMRVDEMGAVVPLDADEIAKNKDLTTVKCCFPGAVAFQVRTGQQWTVAGAISGFLHHVVADPDNGGRCRNNCDPVASRRNGRVVEAATGADDAFLFVNPMFSFGIQQGEARSYTLTDRDKYWSFTTAGSFQPLVAALSNDTTALIQPQALSFLAPTGEVAIPDGSINGLIFLSLSSVTFSRSFY